MEFKHMTIARLNREMRDRLDDVERMKQLYGGIDPDSLIAGELNEILYCIGRKNARVAQQTPTWLLA